MARSPYPSRLNLWMNGLQVGHWETTRSGERLVYHDDWISDPQGRPLSLSLPFTPGNQPYPGAGSGSGQQYAGGAGPGSNQPYPGATSGSGQPYSGAGAGALE